MPARRVVVRYPPALFRPGFAVTLAWLALLCGAAPAAANVIHVTTLDDAVTPDGNCSLREAILAADTDAAVDQCDAGSGDDEIVFDVAGRIDITAPFQPTSNITITGPGRDLLTIDGADATRAFVLDTPGQRTQMSGFAVRNCLAGRGDSGGAFLIRQGTHTLTRLELYNNRSDYGGAVGVFGNTVVIVDSVLRDNTAGNGAAMYVSGGSATIRHTTLSGNIATGRGGAVRVVDPGAVAVDASTISGNTADEGGGIAVRGSALTVTDSTVTNNSAASQGSGIYYAGFGPGTPFNLTRSIVAGNTGAADLSGNPTSTSCSLVGGDPKLGPLQDNGGPTPTHAPLADSPAIDACERATGDELQFDQRGAGFHRWMGPRVDQGAVESWYPNEAPSFTAGPAVLVGEDAGTQTVSGWVTDIAAGPPAEAWQTLTFAVTAISNPTLFAVAPAVSSDGTLTFTPAPNAFGSSTVTLTLRDDGGTASGGIDTSTPHAFSITVAPVADDPAITGASTVVNAQTSSGLVITRNAADGPEVTHFKVVAVTGGTLFLADGTTPVAPGAFVSAAQGGAGLRFTPAPDSIASAQVVVRAATNADDAGLGGGTASATISVARGRTTSTLTAGRSTAVVGQAVTLTATVAPVAPAAGSVAGEVEFRDGGTVLGRVTLSGGTATWVTSSLSAGTHAIAAVFGGGVTWDGSTASATIELSTLRFTVDTPGGGDSFDADTPFLEVSGSAEPGTSVTWHAGSGRSGTATIESAAPVGGLAPWVATVGLSAGANPITFTARDADGNTVSHTVTVTVDHFSYALAEGVTGPSFDTYLLLANPGAADVSATLRYLQPDGTSATKPVTVPAGRRVTLRVDDDAAVSAFEFAPVTTSDAAHPLLVERATYWGPGYRAGSAASADTPASTTWYFAEGSLANGMLTYLLLGNAGTQDAHVTVQGVPEDGGDPVTRSYVVPAGARTTVPLSQVQELAGRSFGMIVTSDVPLSAERAQYLRDYVGGHVSPGATRPATTWFHAEGATGPFFDTYLLLMNPGPTSATATVQYHLEDGRVVTTAHEVPAARRVTVAVEAEDVALADAAFWIEVNATAPLVSERSMYWPGTAASWAEGHNSVGVREPAAAWGFAEGSSGGPLGFETYYLLANPSPGPATVTIRFLRDGGDPVVKTCDVPGGARVTLPVSRWVPELAEGSFGATLTATSPIVVERSMYWTADGRPMRGGTNAIAIRLP